MLLFTTNFRQPQNIPQRDEEHNQYTEDPVRDLAHLDPKLPNKAVLLADVSPLGDLFPGYSAEALPSQSH